MLRGAGIASGSFIMSLQPRETGGGEAARGGAAMGSGVTVVRLLGTAEATVLEELFLAGGPMSKLGVELLKDGFMIPSGVAGGRGKLMDMWRSGIYRRCGECSPGISELHLESRPGK
jgi:hypothetical protein